MTHIPVLLNECLEIFGPLLHTWHREQHTRHRAPLITDTTLGRAGHASAFLEASPEIRLLGIDRDQDAIAYCTEALGKYGDRVTLVKSNFGRTREILNELGAEKTDGLLSDLGVSSPQLDETDRGFSYQKSSRLDLRMDRTQELTAEIIVNTWHRDEITKILFTLGEERYAKQISAAIVREREKEPIITTDRLASIVASAMPGGGRKEKQPPAARTFLGLRLAVNRELEETAQLLDTIPDILNKDGIAIFISFHSLEDKLVKSAFRKYSDGCTCNKDFPCVCGFVPSLEVLTKKPIIPGEREISANPRARSAKLRAARKI